MTIDSESLCLKISKLEIFLLHDIYVIHHLALFDQI